MADSTQANTAPVPVLCHRGGPETSSPSPPQVGFEEYLAAAPVIFSRPFQGWSHVEVKSFEFTPSYAALYKHSPFRKFISYRKPSLI
jgi:hypothetical protein